MLYDDHKTVADAEDKDTHLFIYFLRMIEKTIL